MNQDTNKRISINQLLFEELITRFRLMPSGQFTINDQENLLKGLWESIREVENGKEIDKEEKIITKK